MTAYFYKLKHKTTNKIYVGCQYGKKADPSKLWLSYFTSSKEIKRIIEADGADSFNIEKIQCREDAREYENKYLKKAYSLLGKEKFLSLFINRNLAPGIIQLPEEYERRKKLWAEFPDKKPIPPNWKNKKRSNQMKERLSKTNSGHVVSDQTRKKISNSLTGRYSMTPESINKRQQTILERYGSTSKCFGVLKNTWEITHPDGTIEVVNNINEWCKIRNVSQGKLKRGTLKGFICKLISKKN